MKRFALVVVTALAALAVASCGGDDKAPESTGTKIDWSKKVTLTVWDFGVPDSKAMARADEAYMAKHPNVTIKRVHQPATAYLPPGPLLRATVAKGKGPDLMATYASPFVFDYVQGARPINEFVTEKDRADRLGWEATTRANGDTYVIPFDANGVLFYYDKAKFTEAGLDAEAPPQTWDELMAACDALSDAGIVPINAGWKDGGLFTWWNTLFATQYQSDGELAKAASAPNWDTPGAQKAVDLLHEAQDHKCFTPGAEGINLFPDAVNNFKAGKAAMGVGLAAGDAHWAQYRETKWGNKGLGAFLAPVAPGGLWDKPRINYGVSTGYFITRWSPNAAVAANYLLFLSSPEMQTQIATEAAIGPANIKAQVKYDDPVATEIADWTRTADPYLDQWTLIGSNVLGVMIKYSAQVVTGDKQYSDIVGEMESAQEKSPK